MVLAGVLLGNAAEACTRIGATSNPRHDRRYDTYPSLPNIEMALVYGITQWHECTVDSTEALVRVDIPGLREVGTRRIEGVDVPTYEAGPDSALMAFTFNRVVGWPMLPIRVGEINSYRQSLDGDPSTFNVRVYLFSRGGRMRTFEVNGNVEILNPKFPIVDTHLPLYIRMEFPATTCPVRDAAETLQDVQVSQLGTPGSTANEKRVAVRMECGVDPPRARMTLTDAGDAANVGSQLTPTADSDAEGVRVQLLRNGIEVQFGQVWGFDPGTGGVHEHEFTARYIRTSESLVPGMIKGEAVLNVDYW